MMHPHNPFAPTMHFNYRYFETEVSPARISEATVPLSMTKVYNASGLHHVHHQQDQDLPFPLPSRQAVDGLLVCRNGMASPGSGGLAEAQTSPPHM